MTEPSWMPPPPAPGPSPDSWDAADVGPDAAAQSLNGAPVPVLQSRPDRLVRVRGGVGRALFVAVLLVVVTDLVVAGAVVLQRHTLSGLSAPGRAAAFSLLVAAGYLGGAALAVLLTKPRDASARESYGFRAVDAGAVMLAIGVALGARVAGVAWSALLMAFKLELPGMDADPTSMLPRTPIGILLAVVIFALVAPFAEELVFRGVLFGTFEQHMRFWPAALLSSALFAGLHFNLFSSVPVFIAAIGFAWLFRRSRSLWASVVSHAAFNLSGLLVIYALKFLPVVGS